MAGPAGLNGAVAPPWELRLRVWIEADGTWHALADFGDGHPRVFDSPFELARFVSRLPWPEPSADPGGLR